MSEYIRTNRDDDNGCKDNYDGNFVDTDDKNYQKKHSNSKHLPFSATTTLQKSGQRPSKVSFSVDVFPVSQSHS